MQRLRAAASGSLTSARPCPPWPGDSAHHPDIPAGPDCSTSRERPLPRLCASARYVARGAAGPMAHYVDLHAHYLPALDDGATDRQMSLQMVRADRRARVLRPLRHAAPAGRNVHAGARERSTRRSRRLSEDAARRRRQARRWASAPRTSGTRSFTIGCASAAVPALRRRRRVPVRGRHADDAGRASRTSCFSCGWAVTCRSWPTPSATWPSSATSRWPSGSARHAALMIDLGALDGAHGKQEMKTARKLVLEGLAHGGRLRHPPPRGPDLGRGRDGLDPQAAGDGRARPDAGREPAPAAGRRAAGPAPTRLAALARSASVRLFVDRL